MHKSEKKGPDRVILFEIGIIIALLFLNYVLNLSYSPSNILGTMDEQLTNDDWEINAVTYPSPPQPKIEKSKLEKTTPFNPITPILFVADKLKNFAITNDDPIANLKPPGKLIAPINIQTNTGLSDSVVIFADILPEFPGGATARERHIGENFNFNNDMLMMVSEVEVVLQFVVNKNGEISDIKVLKCSRKGLGIEKEAIRMFEAMPKWKPASVKGKPVNCRMIQPIRLRVY